MPLVDGKWVSEANMEGKYNPSALRQEGYEYSDGNWTKPAPKPDKPKPAPRGCAPKRGCGDSGGGTFTPQYQVGSIKPKTRKVDEATETVSGRLETILNEDNPYLQRAQLRGRQIANQRGLLNTSLAAEAGEAAAIDAALPIAQQDANTFFSQSINNQNATNTFRLQDMQFLQNLDLAEQGFGHQQALQAAGFGHQMALFNKEMQARLDAEYRNSVLSALTNPNATPEQQSQAFGFVNDVYSTSGARTLNYGDLSSGQGRYGFA